jgi:hypothetical protein
MTLHPIPSEFLYIGGKFSFLFYQCTVCTITFCILFACLMRECSEYIKDSDDLFDGPLVSPDPPPGH